MMDDLVKIENTYYKKLSVVPFSGNIQRRYQGSLIDCKREENGLFTIKRDKFLKK